jgi:hypothetical protein
MKPICVPCERFMRPKKNGFYFIEGMPHSHPTETWDEKQGKGSTGWSPYKIWVGDLWECPTCKTQTVSGVARIPIAEHYQPEFIDLAKKLGADRFMVKDC